MQAFNIETLTNKHSFEISWRTKFNETINKYAMYLKCVSIDSHIIHCAPYGSTGNCPFWTCTGQQDWTILYFAHIHLIVTYTIYL